LGYQSKSIVNKIIKLFYVFMLASIDMSKWRCEIKISFIIHTPFHIFI